MNEKYFIDDVAFVFSFGKHKGETLFTVITQDESYLYWCVNNIKEITFTRDVLEQIEKLFPEFYITEKFYSHLEENQDWGEDDDYYEDYELRDQYGNYFDSYNHGYMEEETYERYNGTYAQDVAGYSDDEIDTIFEGDPSAYWNID